MSRQRTLSLLVLITLSVVGFVEIISGQTSAELLLYAIGRSEKPYVIEHIFSILGSVAILSICVEYVPKWIKNVKSRWVSAIKTIIIAVPLVVVVYVVKGDEPENLRLWTAALVLVVLISLRIIGVYLDKRSEKKEETDDEHSVL